MIGDDDDKPGAPDTGPADDQVHGGKPGDRPLPPAPPGPPTDQDKARDESTYKVFPDDANDDNRHDS